MSEGTPVDDDLRARSITELLEQISRRNERIAHLQQELEQVRVRLRDAERRASEAAGLLANAERKLSKSDAQHAAELAAARREVQRIKSSRGYRLVEGYRARIKRIAPPGTARNKIYRALTWLPRRMLRARS